MKIIPRKDCSGNSKLLNLDTTFIQYNKQNCTVKSSSKILWHIIQ